jgi:hypothetical protein
MTLQEQLAAISTATGGDLYDSEYEGGAWMVEAVQTSETIDNFILASNNWIERSSMKRGVIAGLPFVVWQKMQSVRGMQRRSMAVIDFGEIRFAVNADLDSFTT